MTGFDRFWGVWPANTMTYTRKGCKAECLKRWIARHHETQADQIVKHVEWLKTTADWLKDGGAFIPAPLVYLNQQRWDGADIPETGRQETAAEYVQRMAAERARDVRAAPDPRILEKVRALGSRRGA
jgi:hypothetical protein